LRFQISNLCIFAESVAPTARKQQMEKVLKEERARILQEGEELIRTFNGHY
jgi:hypothetical protein